MPVFDDLVPIEAGDAERRLLAAIRAAAATIPAALPSLTWDPDRCPIEWLPVLAEAAGVPCLRADGTTELTPMIIRLGLRVAREAGTHQAVLSLLAAGGAVGATVTEPPVESFRELKIVIQNAAALDIELACLVEWLHAAARRSVKLSVVAHSGISASLSLQAVFAGAVVAVVPTGRLHEAL